MEVNVFKHLVAMLLFGFSLGWSLFGLTCPSPTAPNPVRDLIPIGIVIIAWVILILA